MATKTIYIHSKAENQIATLIHEICHALAPRLNHGGAWQARMLKAASRAEQFGELSLAECLRSQVTGYRRENVERVTLRTIYTDIEEAVEESAVIPSFKSMLRVLARDNLKTPTEFLAQFPRSEKVYARAVSQRRT